ncbi:hypothetical protein AX17_007192 [Amanita inopinata Kibby_2008]|nr:hypothetical protein AX17_007192 [Amanita inopinata Kibby_2008]
MRILTWNINGVRTLPQYYPWNTYKTFDGVLNHLEADIICFQETKTSRSALPKSVALPPSYYSFFSFPSRKTGYSGVAVYTRSKFTIPIKAEEGLTGLLQPKPPLSDAERVSGTNVYPPLLVNEGDWRGEALDSNLDFPDLDGEGRTLTLDFGLFVLINVYCPNDGTGTEERDKYKIDFHRLLELRVRGLVEKERREVMVVGDINACAAVIDHCEGTLMVARGQAMGMEGDEGFWEKGFRRWLRDLLVHEEDGTDGGGCMVDIVRRFWPDRKGMYTCWNTKISARESNYGTRIDYILVTKGLVTWIKAADVQQDVKGSDHCPVFVDLHDQITNADGSITRLRDVLGARVQTPSGATPEPPRLATKFWDEYSGKQTQLDKFFGRKASSQSTKERSASEEDSQVVTPSNEAGPTFSQQCVESISSGLPTASATDLRNKSPISVPASSPTSTTPSTTTATSATTAAPHSTSRPLKRKLVSETTLEKVVSKKQKGKKVQGKNKSEFVAPAASQTKLSSFFAKPRAAAETGESTVVDLDPSLDAVDPKPGTSNGSKEREKCRGKKKNTEGLQFVDCSMDIIDVDDYPLGLESNDPDTEIEEQCDPSFQPSSSQGSSYSLTPFTLSASQVSKNGNGNGKQAWSSLLAPTPIPLCKVHNEPAKEFTVNKPGLNKGKRFFVCSRYVHFIHRFSS